MKKYWILAVMFVFAVAISTIVIRTLATKEYPVVASDAEYATTTAQITIRPINPTEYIRKLTESPKRIPTTQTKPIATINPTEYIRRLTEAPKRYPTTHIMNPTDYIRKLTETPNRIPSSEIKRIPLKGSPAPKEFFATQSGLLTEKLTEERLRKCEEKSREIVERSSKLNEEIEVMMGKLAAIVVGIKEYYVKKNLSVTNYTWLLDNIEIKKTAVGPLLAAAKADIDSFSCAGENPSLQLKKHRDDMGLVLDAIHSYRSSIKDLISAIKQSAEISITPTGAQQ